MFSVYIELLSGIVEDVKKDRKAHLEIRWTKTVRTATKMVKLLDECNLTFVNSKKDFLNFEPEAVFFFP